MDCDLHRIILSNQALTEMHYKCFARQILEGLKVMHTVGYVRKFNFFYDVKTIYLKLAAFLS